jgi:hypothetical protein
MVGVRGAAHGVTFAEPETAARRADKKKNQ